MIRIHINQPVYIMESNIFFPRLMSHFWKNNCRCGRTKIRSQLLMWKAFRSVTPKWGSWKNKNQDTHTRRDTHVRVVLNTQEALNWSIGLSQLYSWNDRVNRRVVRYHIYMDSDDNERSSKYSIVETHITSLWCRLPTCSHVFSGRKTHFGE